MTVKVYLYATESSTELTTCEISGVSSIGEAIEIAERLNGGNGINTNIVVLGEIV